MEAEAKTLFGIKVPASGSRIESLIWIFQEFFNRIFYLPGEIEKIVELKQFDDSMFVTKITHFLFLLIVTAIIF